MPAPDYIAIERAQGLRTKRKTYAQIATAMGIERAYAMKLVRWPRCKECGTLLREAARNELGICGLCELDLSHPD